MQSLHIERKLLKIAAGVSLCFAGGVAIYRIYFASEEKSNAKTIRVPTEHLGILIGRKGQNIRRIESVNHVHIFIARSEGDHTPVTIEGTDEQISRAESEIFDVTQSQLSETIAIPQNSVAQLIGTDGHNIELIRHLAKANINIDRKSTKAMCPINIKGTQEQIDTAKKLIYKSVDKSKSSKIDGSAEILNTKKMPPIKHLSSSENTLEVYVSAIVDPSCFWIQIVSTSAKELDMLVENMTEFYSVEENRNKYKLPNVEQGDFVAAMFPSDKKWYRGKVVNIIDPENVYVFFLDYGDTDMVKVVNLCAIHSEFTSLEAQAIECFLSGIVPIGGTWSPEAIDEFDEMTHTAKWKSMIAKVAEKRETRRDCLVYALELFDAQDWENVSIAQELVRKGYASFNQENKS